MSARVGEGRRAEDKGNSPRDENKEGNAPFLSSRSEAEGSASGFALAEVEQALAGTAFAGQLHHFTSIGSTSTLALEAARAGAAASSVWVADEQTAGRGRGGHTWHSAAGDGLYVSVLLRPALTAGDAARITLAAGLAVQAAVQSATGLRVDIRWPNDLLVDNLKSGERKCGGILVESASAPDGRLRHVVIGIGINVAHTAFPPELAALATSLTIEGGRSFRREPLLIALLHALAAEMGRLEAGAPDLLARFAAASSWVMGKHVRVGDADGYTGWTCGLDAAGFLQVRADDGTIRTVLSGGVRSA